MKKTVALLLAMAFILASVPAMALETKYYSEVLGTEVMMPDTLEVFAELPSADGNSVYIHYGLVGTNKTVIATLTYVPEYVGLTLKDLPREETEGWKEFFSERYPKHNKGVMVKPTTGGSKRVYRYYGMNADGTWILSYTGVIDGLYVCVCCEADRFGYRYSEMRAIFDSFNVSFQMFADSMGVKFEPFDPEVFGVEIYNLLYDDSPTSIFRNY
ncbi:MAG: hypothetical protein IKH57_18895 [Clostridia bacterium]|nr:hypothetical protein [Clostridia bacterium]